VLERHVDGLVLTSNTAEQIVGALTQVMAGQLVLPGGWRSLEPPEPSAGKLAELSGRQREILGLVAEGCSNDQIAAQLFISVNTVKFHVRTLYARLGIHNRVQAALLLADSRSHP
jgi:DNA-binding NarL/FixJ family response regulator